MSKKVNISLDQYLKNKRLELGISQKNLAEKLGYTSAQFVSNWERGLASPPLEALSKLIKILKLDQRFVIDIILSETKKKLQRELKQSAKASGQK